MTGLRPPRGAVLALLGALSATPLMAQGVDCEDLRARIEASSSTGARAGQYASALRRQQYELQRTQTYADSIGCNSIFPFSSSASQCDAMASRIERLQGAIDQLQQQMQSMGDDGERTQALTERYNAYCAGETPQAPLDDAAPDRRVMPVDPDGTAPPPDDDGSWPPPEGRSRRVRALCVRECDGGFFPITDDASSGALEDFDRLCKALCPNTKASLYTAAPTAGIDTAQAMDGTPYTSLPTAFKFQKSFDAACTCKPPHRSWVEALAAAEALIESGHGDVTVTQKMSDAMARPPSASPVPKAPPTVKPGPKTKAAKSLRLPPPPDAPPPDIAGSIPKGQADTRGGDVIRFPSDHTVSE